MRQAKLVNTFLELVSRPINIRTALFVLISVCVLSASFAFFILSMGKPYMGVRISLSESVWMVELVDNYGLAKTAGIVEGDRPILVNDQPAEAFFEKYESAGVVFGNEIREITVADGSGRIKSATLEGNTAPQQYIFSQIIWFIVCLIFWVIGFYVLYKKPGQISSLLFLCALSFGLALSANLAGEIGIATGIEFSIIATTIGPWILVHFFLVLPEERTKFRNNRLVYLIYIPAVITLALFPLIGYSNGQPLPGFRNLRIFEYGVGFLASGILVIFNYVAASSPRTRQQMKIVMISCLGALLPFLILNIIPDVFWGSTVINPGVGVVFIAFIPLGLGYAVVTRKLMDIDVIIRRGVIYGLVTLIMAVILSAAVFSILAFRESLEIYEEILIALVLGAVATFLFGPVKNGVETLVDRFFYKDRYDYRQIIQSLGISLNTVNNFTDVSRLIVGTSVNTLNLSGGCLFIDTRSGTFQVAASQGIYTEKDRQDELLSVISQTNPEIEFPNISKAEPDLAFVIPFEIINRRIGFLCLSQKASRQDFSSGDIYLLQGITSVATIALYSTILVHDVSLRDTFVSVASHELRTPLTAIVGYSDLLLQRNPPDETKKRWLKKIFDNGRKLSTMVDDMLNVSRIQSGKFSITLENVELREALEEVISIEKENTDKHHFIINIEEVLPEVFVDRAKFSQVLTNLISNAIKYSPNGGNIIIAASVIENVQIILSVSDEGIGISPEEKESLFTTFHRIQRPETRNIRGSGLGLYIAKEWIEAMGGQIWLESELNKGSTFYISVPVSKSNGIVNKKFTNVELSK